MAEEKLENYDLWCLFEHDTKPFNVSISPTRTIFGLKELIHQERALVRYHPTELDLTKVNLDCDESKSVILAGQYQPSPDDVSLRAAETISKVWPTEPSSDFVSVFVRLPTTVLGKRMRYSVTSVDEPSQISRTAPSQMGKLSEYMSLHEDDRKILDDRPEQDSVAPASLLYDGYGHFLDIFRRREEAPALTDDRRQLEVTVNVFAEAMAALYETDDERKEKGLAALNAILMLDSHEMDPGPDFEGGINMKALKAVMRLGGINPGYNTLTAASVDSESSGVHSDGHYNGPHEAISCVVSFKNELVDIHSMPLLELTTHIARSHAQSRKTHKWLYLGWRVPCLGLTIVGPYVTFYAVIYFPNRQLRVVSLTPALSCVASAGEGDDRKTLYAAFEGALVLLRHIDDDAESFLNGPPTISHADCNFPYISALPKYDAPGEVHFRIHMLHPDVQDYRLMYIAEVLHGSRPEEQDWEQEPQLIMVKFTRRYSIALHAFCAERGCAPVIRGFKQIPGGWSVVAMDLVMPPDPPSISPSFPRLLDKWTEDLQNLMRSFHDAGFVHGDLREPNILCDGEKLKLIDYDWGGVVGEARYPHAQLCYELTNGRNGSDPRITKDDDKRILQDTLDGLKNRASYTR